MLMGKKSLGNARLDVTYTYYFKTKHKTDVANYEKLLSDSMEGILFDNDSQIDVMLLVRAGVDKENPRVEITIKKSKPLA